MEGAVSEQGGEKKQETTPSLKPSPSAEQLSQAAKSGKDEEDVVINDSMLTAASPSYYSMFFSQKQLITIFLVLLVSVLVANFVATSFSSSPSNVFGESVYVYQPERREEVPIAFPYCERIGQGRTFEWLTEQRRLNDEARTLGVAMKDWRDLRCRWNEERVLRLDTTFKKYSEGVKKLPEAIAKLSDTWIEDVRPRVEKVFVDAFGSLHYRVFAHDGQGKMRLALLEHAKIVDLLTEWDRQVQKAMRGTKLADYPCICPQHFGIIGSGLYFTPEKSLLRHATRVALLNWRVLANMAVKRETLKSENVTARLPFTETIHIFPAVVDYTIVPDDTSRIITHPSGVWFEAYEPSIIAFDFDLVEKLDMYIGAQWASDADTKLEWAALIDLERRDVATATAVNGAGTPSATRCFFHCNMLENALFSRAAELKPARPKAEMQKVEEPAPAPVTLEEAQTTQQRRRPPRRKSK